MYIYTYNVHVHSLYMCHNLKYMITLEMERKKERKKDGDLRQMKKWKWVASGGIRTHDTVHSGQMLVPVVFNIDTDNWIGIGH